MNLETQRALVALNRRFYEEHAESFDSTRSAPWKGWSRLLETVTIDSGPLRVLDLGCGNGRFGALVEKHWPEPWTYLGLDASAELLEAAAARLEAGIRRELRTWDLLEEPLSSAVEGTYDLVAIFGVLHHVPGAALRRQLLVDAAALLAPGGYLAFTVWRFAEDPRFERRVIPWDAILPAFPGLATEELEAGDVLLRWGDEDGALRYCHGASEDEQEDWLKALTDASSLDLELRFDADGKTGQLNRYYLLKRPNPQGP